MTTNAAKARGKLTPDLIAGVTTGMTNIPDAMATAILAPPVIRLRFLLILCYTVVEAH